MDVQASPVNESVSVFLRIVQSAFPEVTDKLKNAQTIDDIWDQLPIITKLSLVQITNRISQHAQLPSIDNLEVNKNAIQLFPASFINDNEIAPFELGDKVIKIAISNPFDKELEKNSDLSPTATSNFIWLHRRKLSKHSMPSSLIVNMPQ